MPTAASAFAGSSKTFNKDTMEPELERYYEDVLAIFTTPGWKSIVEDLTTLREKLNSVRECSNLDRAKGQVDILDHVLGLPLLFESAYKDLKEEATE